MALKLWYLMNGEQTSQGLDNTSLTPASIAYADGKNGKCAVFNGASSYFSLPNTVLNKDTPYFSVCAWVKLNQSGRTETLFSSRTEIGYGISIFKSNENKFRFDSGDTMWIPNYNYTSTTWNHICFVRDATNKKCYINGVLADSTTSIGSLEKISTKASIGASSIDGVSFGNFLNGFISDFRFYDHALSPKEIKEISQGLIMHYPLSSPYMEPVTNLYGNQYENGDGSIGGFTKTIHVEDNGIPYTNYAFIKQPSVSNSWFTIRYAYYTFAANKNYTISMDVRVNSCDSSSSLALRHARLGNDYFGCKSVTVAAKSLVGKGWIHYSLTQPIPASFVYKSETKICSPLIELYTNNLAVASGDTTIHNMDIDIRKVQVIEKEHDLPYTPVENSGYVDDCSGFNNHGSIQLSTAPSWDGNSIRYSGCYKFTGSQFIIASQNAKITDSITVSIWGYMDSWNENQRLISCTEGGGWNIESNEGYLSFPVFVSTIGYISAKSTILWSSLKNGWHHFAGTYDGLSIKLYLDGALISSAATGKTTRLPIGYHNGNTIFIGAEAGNNATTPVGSFLNGKISDVRIYSTALNDNDIQTLYSVKASISSNGILLVTGEIIEK